MNSAKWSFSITIGGIVYDDPCMTTKYFSPMSMSSSLTVASFPGSPAHKSLAKVQ